MGTSIIVPAHNEEGNITLIYKEIIQALKGLHFEIILVDDASTDSTYSEMKKIIDNGV